ncbi:MAG: glycosyltransferase family 2 protein [Bacteroidales bacterium]|jgi:GT2 family glycosyltransferase|nr:glycosyltransferase family 2 protein [Bacteroidales bacterium]
MKMTKIGIVVVSYKNAAMTARYVREELSRLTCPHDLVVVANAASVEEGRALAEACGIAESDVVASAENLGYARGNNLGVRTLLQRGEFSHFLFTNDDIEIRDADILERLADTMQRHDDVAAIGPRIVGLDGRDQSPHDRYISPWRLIGWRLFSFLRRRQGVAEASADETPQSRYTYWVQGSFMLVDAEAFRRVGMFDEGTFLYFEEPILAEKFRAIGRRMYFDASCSVVHYEGSSTKSNPNRERIENESRMLYFRKYRGVSPIVLWLLKIVLQWNK